MTECDTDQRHAPATHTVEKGALLLTLCDHCTYWSPRLANALTRDGWEAHELLTATHDDVDHIDAELAKHTATNRD